MGGTSTRSSDEVNWLKISLSPLCQERGRLVYLQCLNDLRDTDPLSLELADEYVPLPSWLVLAAAAAVQRFLEAVGLGGAHMILLYRERRCLNHWG